MHDLTRAINDTSKDPKNIPTWLTSGITFLFSKGKEKKKIQETSAQLLASPKYIRSS
jgi:hypothetical protein